MLRKQNKAGLTQKKICLVSSTDQNALEILKQFKMTTIFFLLVSLMEN